MTVSLASQAQEGGSSADLAKQLSNPVASLISVPMQINYDSNIGPRDDGERWTTNIQPVIPVSIGEDWNLISRTILPVISQEDIFPGAGSQDGIGDVVQSVFFSPKAPSDSGWIWGVGPVLLLPTGSDDLLTADKWGAGPTGVALKQVGQWTFGALANHLVDFAGDDDRGDVNSTFVQPFIAYNTPTATTIAMNLETTYDWEADEASVPVNLMVNQVLKFGGQLVQVGAGVRYWLESTDAGPEGWGGRINLVLLFPK
ncbi:transporter [Parahaliea maris]|uniref:Transporter n=1 Tax=Parahaliea maris TaxID=2716870 RepID=A0A5C9A4Q3_9GAMM|nr:transporter [Parahaliea maris]